MIDREAVGVVPVVAACFEKQPPADGAARQEVLSSIAWENTADGLGR